ncbi:HD domain-containing phosphohydrolase [Desulfosporosinus hippei]|uniref:PAS domain S-box-containing protein/diguanylate cyclase (GGDEF) domain-containing protein n=1 Tax=Desulfosporosinus hippei DSM 8344 TaxID=1121419 RepID=A0A1G8J4V5_9FIRM|nr:HD domain-containing phosphohydrolase [Desulfosporosinus hippei]SDI26266.1 PAS domain S-box-containing protein/diguanylate cyclase (GGDEF) domain-containing protein [Desulfosporosinus hippei DSM 8344]
MGTESLFSVVSLVSVAIYAYIGIYTFTQNPKSLVHKVFLLLCSSYAIWSFAYSFAYIAHDKISFSFWNKISAIGWCSFSALTLYLVLLITENPILKYRVAKVLIFLPAGIFFYMAIFLFGEGIETSKVTTNIFYVGNFLYNFLFLLISILTLLFWGLKTSNVRIKKQSFILVTCSGIPFILNLLTQDILPLVVRIQFPLMGQLYSIIMILGTYRVITKYKFLRLPERYIFEEVVKEIMDMVILLDAKGMIIKISQHTLSLLEFKEDELINQDIDVILEEKRRRILIDSLKDSSKLNDINLLKKSGERIPVNISYKQIIDDKLHDLLGVILVIQDIRLLYDLRRKNEELHAYVQQVEASEYTFRKLFEGSSDSILIMEENKIIDCNPATTRLLGTDSKEILIGKNLWELSPEYQPDGILSEEKAQAMNKQAKTTGEAKFEWWHKKENGIEFPVEIMLTSILLNGKQVFHGLLRDVTEHKQLENRLEYLSYNDVLTGLYNRRFFEEELKRLDVPRNLPLTIVMADVNGLKLINDSFGHIMGDELLQKVSSAIAKGCRSGDIIARLGGDEFVILLPKTGVKETEQLVKGIKAYSKNEQVGSIELSISFGWETKHNPEENILEVFKKAEDRMYKKKLFESPSMRGKTIKAIISTLHEKNKREEQHSYRVSELCKNIGKALSLSEGDIEELKTVGLLHDIGKIAIEEATLNKPGKLTELEWEEIKRHPEIGYRILSTVNDMAEIAEYVLCHHEKWNGMGYPKGLKGEEIPLQARIIAIADAYDAMTSQRSYRSALPEVIALEELQNNAGIQFDPMILNVFIETVLNKLSRNDSQAG